MLISSSCNTAQNDNLQVHEEKNRGVYVKGLSDYYVSSAREVYEIMRTGAAARVVTSTCVFPLLILHTWLSHLQIRHEC